MNDDDSRLARLLEYNPVEEFCILCERFNDELDELELLIDPRHPEETKILLLESIQELRVWFVNEVEYVLNGGQFGDDAP